MKSRRRVDPLAKANDVLNQHDDGEKCEECRPDGSCSRRDQANAFMENLGRRRA